MRRSSTSSLGVQEIEIGLMTGTAVEDDRRVTRFFHVTSSLNRASISAHGLDWTRMGAASGIAGSPTPEQEGCFVARDESEADFFVSFARDSSVDVWAVRGVSASELIESPEGFVFVPRSIPAEDLELVRAHARVP